MHGVVLILNSKFTLKVTVISKIEQYVSILDLELHHGVNWIWINEDFD